MLQPAPLPSPSDELDLLSAGTFLWRSKVLILATTAVLTLAGTGVVSMMTPKYTAETVVVFDPNGPKLIAFDPTGTSAGVRTDADTVLTEIEVIRSRSLARKIVDRLKLDQLPEFTPRLAERPWTRWLSAPWIESVRLWIDTTWIAKWIAKWIVKPAAPDSAARSETGAGANQPDQKASVIDVFLGRLKVTPRSTSRAVVVEFTSESPQLAADVANAVAEGYISTQLDAKFGRVQQTGQWLNERVAVLRGRVEASEQAVENYRRDARLFSEGSGTSLVNQRLADQTTQMTQAQIARTGAEARLRQVQMLMAPGGSRGIDTTTEVLSSPLIQHLRQQETELQRNAAQLSSELGERHPKIRQIDAQVRDLQGRIQAEVAKIASALENEVRIAREKERRLAQNIDQIKGDVLQENRAEIELRTLKREAAANQAVLETFLSRFKRTTEEENKSLQDPDAQIVSRADVPEWPSHPRVKLIVLMTLIAAFVVGILLAIIREKRSQIRLRSTENVEARIGLQVLGMVPITTGLDRTKRSFNPSRIWKFLLTRSGSAFAEAIYNCHTSLVLASGAWAPKIVAVTSAQPREGKTTFAVSLSCSAAFTGQRVLIIDADLRRAEVGNALGLAEGPGMAEVLAGKCTFEDVVVPDGIAGADVVTAGLSRTRITPLATDRLQAFLDCARERYDLIVIDAPPVLAVSDARVISRFADATIFLVRWHDTQESVARLALRQVASAGGRIAGIVLTMVDPRKHARVPEADAVYSSYRMQEYYRNRAA
jgi:capsular exopolysaccharide synthesis family protein